MNKQFTWKFALVALVTAISLFYLWPPQEKIRLGLDLKGGTSFLLRMDTTNLVAEGRATALQQAIEVIERRVNKFGVSEPIITVIGTERILVQLPGLAEKDRLEARRTIQQAAYLEFRLVHEDNPRLQAEAETDPRFLPPPGYTNLTMTATRNGRTETNKYFVKIRPEMSGKSLKQAFPQIDAMGRAEVGMQFTDEGARQFARLVAANPERQLAIVLDGELQSAPVIRRELSDDARLIGTIKQAQITGDFSLVEVRRLASILENPLEAPIQIEEERAVDPTLGKDSIRAGVRAAIIGAVVVLVFMVVYYFLAGAIADLMLVLNLIILLGVLAIFKFTLTLPGIAGIVLTIGMAVDANVLIYERIREELRAGKPLRAAIGAGYQRAWLVIFDSNFTTIMTAAILIGLGTGPVKGFGVTLVIGLLANLFSAVFVTRLLFDWLVAKQWLSSFNMLQVFRKATQIDFLGVRKIAFAASWALILLGVVFFLRRGGLDLGHGEIYGIDFKGGDSITLRFEQRVRPELIGRVLDQAGIAERFIQYQRDLSGEGEVLNLRLPEGASEKAMAALQAAPETSPARFSIIGSERVGATVGHQLLKQGLLALAFALVAIMLYIAFRFGELSYGLGAIFALAHDLLMTIGWFSLTGRSFSMPVVAALLALIGYSINDTIVVFDRIRENRKLTGGRLNYFDLINRSVNETLSRTILTAGTTLATALALYAFGGSVLNDFAFCFTIGVITGTYSSIYMASPVVLWFHRKEARAALARSAKA